MSTSGSSSGESPTRASNTATRKRSGLGLRLVAAAASALLAAAVGELALTLGDWPPAIGSLRFLGQEVDSENVFRPEPQLFWRLDPNTERYSANALGLRGWLPQSPKSPATLRIACIGDSCTFGSGVRYEETWGLQLERLLQETFPERNVETVLAALPGYSTHQSRALFDQHIAALEPDFTILYVGAWNDLVAAIGMSDVERSAALHPTGLARYAFPRLRRLFDQLRARELEAERTAASDAFRDGTYVDGPRVAPEQFRANVHALIERARGTGSQPILVLPPHPAPTGETWPVTEDYRSLLREVAASGSVPVVDGPALFAPHTPPADAPEWIPEVRLLWPLFSDWVHPTPLGHGLLAEALHKLVVTSATPSNSVPPALTLEGVDVRRDGAALELLVRGAGFAGPDAPERSWLGDLWVRDATVLNDRELRLRLPFPLPAGPRDLELRTPRGRVLLAHAVDVGAIELMAELQKQGDGSGHEFVLELDAQPGAHVRTWVSTELRGVPAETRAGLFELIAAPDGRAPGAASGSPFLFERLGLPTFQGSCDAEGRLEQRFDVDLEKIDPAARVFYLQSLVVDASVLEYSALTSVARIDLPSD